MCSILFVVSHNAFRDLSARIARVSMLQEVQYTREQCRILNCRGGDDDFVLQNCEASQNFSNPAGMKS